MEYLLAHDLGTSGDKAVLFDTSGRVIAETTAPYPVGYPFEKAAEQDPMDWWAAFCKATQELLNKSGVQGSDILAVSFSGQMNSCLPIDAQGNPLRKAMIWADQRAGKQAEKIIAVLGLEHIYQLTGQRLSASHAVAKMAWFMEREAELYQKTAKFLQPKDFLALRLTGVMGSDYSDASHLGCLDMKRLSWSEEMLDAAGIGMDRMPELRLSTAIVGKVTRQASQECGLTEGTPVVAGGGDGACATAGAGVSQAGEAYCAMGTSAWVAALSENLYLDPEMRTFNLIYLDGRHYMPLGSVQAAGLSMKWAADTLYADWKEDQFFSLLPDIVTGVPAGSRGLIFLPYLLGERSPWWNPDATGCFIGLTIRHTREDMLRSVLEGVGLNIKIILDSLAGGIRIDRFSVIGGGARSLSWLQILADIWQRPLQVPAVLEYAASMGAALCAGVGAGVYGSLNEAAKVNPIRTAILPEEGTKAIYAASLDRFLRIYNALEPVAFKGA